MYAILTSTTSYVTGHQPQTVDDTVNQSGQVMTQITDLGDSKA